MAEYINFDKNWSKSNKTKINDTKTNEYISKAELMNERPEWLNTNMWNKEKSAHNNGWNDCNDEWLNIITEMPTIDIAHCSECIHAKLDWANGEYYCSRHQDVFVKDYYCADGERGVINNG